MNLHIRSIFDDTPGTDLLAELKRSEHTYQSLVDTVDGIVWQADPEFFQFSFISKSAKNYWVILYSNGLTGLGFGRIIFTLMIRKELCCIVQPVPDKKNRISLNIE